MSRLLIVHHTPSPHCQEMFEAVVAGATDPDIEGVEVVRRPALTVSPVEMLEADGYVLGTPANLGYLSGAMKHLCAIRELLVVPAPERLDQLMAPNCRITIYVARWLARQRCTTDCRHPCATDLVARCHVDQGSVTRVHRGLMGCLAARAKG